MTGGKSKRKRTLSPERNTHFLKTAPQDFQLSKAVRAGIRAYEYVETKTESPWRSFHRVFELRYEDFKTVTARKAHPCELVVVQKLESSEQLDLLQQLRHENIVPFFESFRSEDRIYAILEYIPVSLAQIVASPPYPTEPQLAVILGQASWSDPLHIDIHVILAFERLELSQFERFGTWFVSLFRRFNKLHRRGQDR